MQNKEVPVPGTVFHQITSDSSKMATLYDVAALLTAKQSFIPSSVRYLKTAWQSTRQCSLPML